MASTGRIVFSLLVAAAGATIVGLLISMRPQTDPMTTGSTRGSSFEASATRHRAKMPADRNSSTPQEVRAFFDAQLRQIKQR